MNADFITGKELQKIDPVFGQLSFDDHEQIVFCNDKDTGLKAIIGIHNSIMGLLWEEQECGIMPTNGKH